MTSCSTTHREFTVGYLFCGSGPGAMGHDLAHVEVNGFTASWRNLGGVDFEQKCCDDFRYLTGAPALCADIATLTPEELRAFWGPRAPDMVKMSPPCKGASRLLPSDMASSQKYQDMNELMFLAVRLVLAAYPDPLNQPMLFVVENVPSFRTRCRGVLAKTIRLGRVAGFEVDVRTHNLGEEGGLAQTRERFTLAMRKAVLCPVQVGMPPQQRLRGVGEVLGPLPWPDDPRAGRMHRLPRVSWLNCVRLSLIPPGGDWRDLPKRGQVVETLTALGLWPTGMDTAEFRTLVEEQLGNPVEQGQQRREVHRRHPVQAWAEPAPTVAGPGGAGLCAVEDPRPLEALAMRADARPGAAGVIGWDGPSGTIIATSWVSGGSSPVSAADPRALEQLGLGRTGEGADGFKGRPGLFGVGDWGSPSPTVPAKSTVSGGNSQSAVADERVERLGLGAPGRNGFYGVLSWTSTAGTITGSMQLDNGPCCVADPRMPPPRPVIDIKLALQLLAEGWEPPKGLPAPAILSPLSGCWHRPLTTLEMAVLQGLPPVHNGVPLVLAGNSDSRWREAIGNAIPVGGALAWGRVTLEALLRSSLGEGWSLRGEYWFDAPMPGEGYAA